MRVQVLFFGQLKEVAGRERDTLELPEGARVSDLLRRYAEVSPGLQPYYDVMAVALNREYSEAGAALHDGDEVALIPPVSGGSGARGEPPPGQPAGRRRYGDNAGEGASATKKVPADASATRTRITWEKINSQAVIEGIKRPEDGAVAVFEGIVRNHSRNRRTLYLDYEAYEPMALKKLEDLAEQALERFAVRDVAIVHRLGRLEIGETSVLIVVASAHRAAAFEACRWTIDTLKRTVPIWKKEYFEDGAVWADGEAFPEDIAKAREIAPPAGSRPASK
jgi:molybdopterin synthase catalytic subunit